MMSELKVYEFDDYDTIATVGTLEEAIKWYENEFGVKVDREEIVEVDPNKTIMFYDAEFKGQRIMPPNEANIGDFIAYGGECLECITLTEAYKRDGEPKKPYVICSTEW